MRRLFAVAVVLAMVLVPATMADFRWAAGMYFYDSDGTTWLIHNPVDNIGVFVQLIHDVDGDGIDGCLAGGTGVTGDDVVWGVSWFGEDTYTINGQWWEPNIGKLMTASSAEDGWYLYARVWNDPAATWNGLNTVVPSGASVRYWDGALWQYDNDVPGTYDMTASESQNVTVDSTPSAIPEPTIAALGLVGLLLIRGFRRMTA
ncbi:MAG: hypothetical protein JXQ75_24235 [Phycisphaerae bacterium]|nr:hypothetical protein [Phycisphaerae bacterium]